ncbi:MAG: hypothetical protein AAGB04_14925 [Pseudomonadota bacterium]
MGLQEPGGEQQVDAAEDRVGGQRCPLLLATVKLQYVAVFEPSVAFTTTVPTAPTPVHGEQCLTALLLAAVTLPKRYLA